MVIDRSNISAIILAGGQGSRFGHRDKGLINWQGKSLIEHVIEKISPQVNDIVISCNRNLPSYQQLGYPCVIDEMSDFQGPLAGIASCLPHINTKYCLICPCDSPILPSLLVTRLGESLTNQQADLSYVFDGDREHYLSCLMKTSLYEGLIDYLSGEDRRVRRWHQGIKAVSCDFSDLKGQFLNINSPEQVDTP